MAITQLNLNGSDCFRLDTLKVNYLVQDIQAAPERRLRADIKMRVSAYRWDELVGARPGVWVKPIRTYVLPLLLKTEEDISIWLEIFDSQEIVREEYHIPTDTMRLGTRERGWFGFIDVADIRAIETPLFHRPHPDEIRASIREVQKPIRKIEM